jgi:alanine dehydrogenase
MIMGAPKEIETHEYRAGMVLVGVEELTRAGASGAG